MYGGVSDGAKVFFLNSSEPLLKAPSATGVKCKIPLLFVDFSVNGRYQLNHKGVCVRSLQTALRSDKTMALTIITS